MKYNVGDHVRIQPLEWYQKEIESEDYFNIFDIFWCSREMTISKIEKSKYLMEEDGQEFYWTDEMIEGLVEEDLIPKFGEYSDNEPLDVPTITTDFVKEHGFPCPKGYVFKDENGNVINATKIVLEKKSPKTDDIIKWLREHDMTKYISVLYSGMCSITFDTEKLIKDITEMIGDE